MREPIHIEYQPTQHRLLVYDPNDPCCSREFLSGTRREVVRNAFANPKETLHSLRLPERVGPRIEVRGGVRENVFNQISKGFELECAKCGSKYTIRLSVKAGEFATK
jgi:hypothetical protein